MDYRYLAVEELGKFIEQETDIENPLSFGDILFTITREKHIDRKFDRSCFREIDDKSWYKIINNARKDEQEQ